MPRVEGKGNHGGPNYAYKCRECGRIVELPIDGLEIIKCMNPSHELRRAATNQTILRATSRSPALFGET
jgi:predicted nucleic acid-binding Zn ribbon protein